MRVSFEGLPGYIFTDDQRELWYVPEDGSQPERLSDKDSLCGAGLFNSGGCDPFLDACKWHDQAYKNRKRYEEHSWTRHKIDEHFYQLMRATAFKHRSKELMKLANIYYEVVRCVGWFFYYRN